jgi:uncharacterized protein YciW
MFGNDEENGFESLLTDITLADHVATVQRIAAIAAYYEAALAGIGGMISERNPDLTAQSRTAVQRIIQTARWLER